MEISVYYITLYVVTAIMILAVIGLSCGLIFLKKNGKNTSKAVRVSMIMSISAALLVAGFMVVLLASHRSYPGVNDWHFLGRNIVDVEQEYVNFDRKYVSDDGSGYAILMTERIVGRSMYDSNDYSCYRMEFDADGTIVSVNCERPLGG